MPKGPFASSVGVGRAEPEWAKLNKVDGICGRDVMHQSGEKTEAPLKLEDEITSGECESLIVPEDGGFDLLIVGAGLSGSVIAERCSKELNMTSLISIKETTSEGTATTSSRTKAFGARNTARIYSTRISKECGSTCKTSRSGSRSIIG